MASQQQIVVFFFCDSRLSVVPKRLCSSENIAPGCNVVVQWRDKTTGTRDLEAAIFFLAESTKAANQFVKQIYSQLQDYVKAGENVQEIYNEICNADKAQRASNKENRQKPSKENVVSNDSVNALQQRSKMAAVAHIPDLRRSPLQQTPSSSFQAREPFTIVQIPANRAPPQEQQTAPPCPQLEAPQIPLHQARPQFETPPRIVQQQAQQPLTTPVQIPLQPARPQFTTPPQIPLQPARPQFETPTRISLQPAQHHHQMPLQPTQLQLTPVPPTISQQHALSPQLMSVLHHDQLDHQQPMYTQMLSVAQRKPHENQFIH